MKNDLTTYQIYLMLLGYLTEQNDDNAQFTQKMLTTLLTELYKRADKTRGETIHDSTYGAELWDID